MEVPRGYKQTSIGIIPEDWSLKEVGKAFKICNNLRFPLSEDVRKTMQGKYPYYGPTKIQDWINEYKVEGKYALIGEDGDHFLKWRDFPMTLLVEGKFNVNNHAHLIRGEHAYQTEWFFYYFNHRELSKYLTRQGAGRYKLTKDSLSKIPIPIPNAVEQQKIAEILSTWDAAIATCKKTIEQLKRRNKGLAQQLLSGKSNRAHDKDLYKDFHVVGKYVREVSTRNSSLQEKRILSVTNSRGFINQSEQFGRELASADLSNYKIVKKGQFAYNPSRVNVGSIDLLTKYESGILSPMYVVFETSTQDLIPEFLYYHLKTYWFTGHIPMFVQGSVRDSLSFDGFSGMKFYIPPVEKQLEIVKYLEAASSELKLYEEKLQTLQQQKKGLMQQLLTGKVRTI